MLFIDQKYVGMVSARLRNFKRKDAYLYNFSCPLCGDSKKKKRKARGYIFRTDADLLFKCWNCSRSMSFGSFLKELDPILYDEYSIERYKEGAGRYTGHKTPAIFTTLKPQIKENTHFEDTVLEGLKRVDLLDLDHPVVGYVKQRQIPQDKWKYLYLCHKYMKWHNLHEHHFDSLENDHPRLVIPYFTEHGKVFMCQARAFDDMEPKYWTLRLDKEREKIYGMDRVDFSKRIYAVEGPLDSLFLDNAIAVTGVSNFDSISMRRMQLNAILIIDREPRNPEIVKVIKKYIKVGYTVCMFPDTCKFKDINDAIILGLSKEEIQGIIEKHSYKGLEAELCLSNWNKVK